MLAAASPSHTVMLTTDAVGGVWRYSLELAAGFAARGMRVLLSVMGPAPDHAQCNEATAIPGLRLIHTGLPLDWLAPAPVQLHDAAHDLARLAAWHRADTIHLHTPALVSDCDWPAPVVAVAHSCVGTWWRSVHGGQMPQDLAWRVDAVAHGLATADAVIAPSRSFAALLAAQYGDIHRIDVVWNGRRPMAATACRARRAFTAGRLWDRGKNVSVINAAAALLDVPVLAAGPLTGPNGDHIDCPHLQCLGPLHEAAMAAQYAAASVFVSMAIYEPFGLAVLEAAQAGCALILADMPTFRELWNGAAHFVPPDDAAALAAAIRQCLDTPGRCAELGAYAKRRAVAFSVEKMVAATWQIHDALHAPVTLTAA